MIVDHDPGDEHHDVWPFYSGAHLFEVSASDDLVVEWHGRTHVGDGWYTAVASIDRTTGRQVIVHADVRVEDITDLVNEADRLTR